MLLYCQNSQLSKRPLHLSYFFYWISMELKINQRCDVFPLCLSDNWLISVLQIELSQRCDANWQSRIDWLSRVGRWVREWVAMSHNKFSLVNIRFEPAYMTSQIPIAHPIKQLGIFFAVSNPFSPHNKLFISLLMSFALSWLFPFLYRVSLTHRLTMVKNYTGLW